ncbi:MAG: riboflavin synthase [Dehalococcoidia bacterium]|nr:MAG: riboflavin synthase [Dehalococcoidia bacterium]
MFTGIVEEIGQVKVLKQNKLTIGAKKVLEGTKVGDSISVNGACLTVTNYSVDSFSVDIMPETIRRTNIGILKPGNTVNLERSMPADGRFGGHFVQGHVDGTGKIKSMVTEGDAVVMEVAAPPEITRYLVEKGYIALDGISLTIVNCDEQAFTVSLVAHTLKNTILQNKRAGDVVNLEVDIMAKYIERAGSAGKRDINMELLGEHGFLST